MATASITICGFSRMVSRTSSRTRSSDRSSADAATGRKTANTVAQRMDFFIGSTPFVGEARLRTGSLRGTRALRPRRSDVGEYGPDFLIAQLPGEAGHAAVELDALQGQRLTAAQLRVLKQDAVGVVPCMPGLVMRGRRQPAVGPRALPVRLPFQVCAMTGCAVLAVEHLTLCQVETFWNDHCSLRLRAPALPPESNQRDGDDGGSSYRDDTPPHQV